MLVAMIQDTRNVEIAGLSFRARGSGQVLTGVVGPKPSKNCPRPAMPLNDLTHADLPLHRWSHHPDSEGMPLFVLDEPVIYVGTTREGLHSVLIGVKETADGPTALGLLQWTHESAGASINHHWPTRSDPPHFSWSVEETNPAACVMNWFPLLPETAHVDCTIDGKSIAESLRPVSRVVVVPVPPDADHRFVDALAYDANGRPILRGRA